jgi:hypothetical protein
MTMPDMPEAPATLVHNGRSAPWRRWVVLVVAAVAAMLAGACAATAVTVLVVRDEPPQETHRYEVRVALEAEATAEQKLAVQAALTSTYPAGTVRLETREEAFERFKERFKGQPEEIAGIPLEAMAESFVTATTAQAFDCSALSPVEPMEGVDIVHVRRLASPGQPEAAVLDCP